MGALDESSRKVQKVNTHAILRHTRHADSIQWGDETFYVGSIRGKAHPLPNTHMDMETVSTPVGRWVEAQEQFQRHQRGEHTLSA